MAGSRCARRLTVRKRAVERAAAGILKVTMEMCLDEAREGMRGGGESTEQMVSWRGEHK